MSGTHDLRCSDCGYLLRGLDERGKCPECGQRIRRSAAERRLRERESGSWRPGADVAVFGSGYVVANAIIIELMMAFDPFLIFYAWPLVVFVGPATAVGAVWIYWFVKRRRNITTPVVFTVAMFFIAWANFTLMEACAASV